MTKKRFTKAEIRAAREKWLTDLETTRAPQVKGFLCKLMPVAGRRPKRSRYGFCCLGRAVVALGKQAGCHLKQREPTEDVRPMRWFLSPGCPYDEDTDVIDTPLADLLGMTKHQHKRAVDMNDIDGKSFKEIAAYFRRIWKMPKK